MKKVIRHGVFETNSSSSHSVSLKYKSDKEEWRKSKEICYEEKELRSAKEKMLLVWGIFTEEKFTTLNWDIQNADDIDDENERKAYLEEMEASRQEYVNIRETLIRECKKVQPIDEEEVRNLMIEAENEPCHHHLCCRYFNEDCLADCTCWCSWNSLYRDLGLNYRKDSVEDFARALFNPNVYFLTEEGFYGGYWYIEKNIF